MAQLEHTRYSKEKLMQDLQQLIEKARNQSYSLGPTDIFALGYLAGKYHLEGFLDNQDQLLPACDEYDKSDDLKLLDTIKETLMDLDVLPGKITS